MKMPARYSKTCTTPYCDRRVCWVNYRSPWAEEARQYNIEPLRLLPHRGGLYT